MAIKPWTTAPAPVRATPATPASTGVPDWSAAKSAPVINNAGINVNTPEHVFNPLNPNKVDIAFPKVNVLKEAFKPSNLLAATKQILPGTSNIVQDIKVDPLSLKANPKKALGDAWDSIKTLVLQEGSNIKALIDGSDTAGKKVGNTLKTVTGAANIIFSPITALFSAANDIPVLGSVSRLVTVPFSAIGEEGAGFGNAIVNKLPISKEAKDQIKPGIQEIFSLAGQLLVGKASGDLGGVKDRLVSKFGVKDAETIINKATELANEKKAGEFPQASPLAENTTPQATVQIPETQFPKQTPLVDAVSQDNALPAKEVPLTQPETTTPEMKTSKLASGVESKAVESGLTTGFEGKPEYATVNMKAQADSAINLLETDPQKAMSIAMGHELPPEGLLPEAVFTAVENRALKNGDVSTLRDLATSSSLTSEATGMGQRIRALAERNPDSAVAKIQEVIKARESKVKGKTKDVVKEIRSEIEKTVPKAKDWNSFIESIKCT